MKLCPSVFFIALITATLSADVAASGFALIEQSASCIGNACAGAAASAEDASTIFFNPAGMSQLSGKQGALALHAIHPSAKFADSGSVPAVFHQSNAGGNGGDAGSLGVLPNAYFVMEINPKIKFNKLKFIKNFLLFILVGFFIIYYYILF